MTKKLSKRTVKIRGKNVTFSRKGDAYFRDGKKVDSSYQRRLARGILAGQTVSEARGHPFGKYEEKRLTREQIEEQEEFHLGAWAEPPTRAGRGKNKAVYYAKFWMTTESIQTVGSPTGSEEACQPITLLLRNPNANDQEGFTYTELTRNFEEIALFTVEKSGMTLCRGNLAEDLIAVWRHSRK